MDAKNLAEQKSSAEEEGNRKSKTESNEMFCKHLQRNILCLSNEISVCISDICEKLDVLHNELTKRNIMTKIREAILERKEKIKKQSEQISSIAKRINNYKVIYDINKLITREANLKLLEKIIHSYYNLVADFTNSICRYIDTDDAKNTECRFAVIFAVLLCTQNALEIYIEC